MELSSNKKKLNLELKSNDIRVHIEETFEALKIIKAMANKDLQSQLKTFSLNSLLNPEDSEKIMEAARSIFLFHDWNIATKGFSSPWGINDLWLKENKDRILLELLNLNMLEEEELSNREKTSLKYAFGFMIGSYLFKVYPELKVMKDRDYFNTLSLFKSTVFRLEEYRITSNNVFTSSGAPRKTKQTLRYIDIYNRALRLGYIDIDFRSDIYLEFLNKWQEEKERFPTFYKREIAVSILNEYEENVFGGEIHLF